MAINRIQFKDKAPLIEGFDLSADIELIRNFRTHASAKRFLTNMGFKNKTAKHIIRKAKEQGIKFS